MFYYVFYVNVKEIVCTIFEQMIKSNAFLAQPLRYLTYSKFEPHVA